MMPRDILALLSTATFVLASCTFASCSSDSPVVHSTTGICFFYAVIQQIIHPRAALAKSMITSASTPQVSRLENTG